MPYAPTTPCGATMQSLPDAEGSWLLWWRLHGERYMQRRSGPVSQDVQGEVGVPRPAIVYGEVVPALLDTLLSVKSEQVQRAAMTAIARIGAAPEDSPEETQGLTERALRDAIALELASSRIETVEDAALALGILGSAADATKLAALLEPEAKIGAGKTAERVPARLRAFAAYGLGLLGHRTEREDVRRFVAQRLWAVANRPEAAVRDVPVACIVAYGLIPLELGGNLVGGDCDSPAHCREGQVHGLLEIFGNDDWDHVVRAHALTAAARLATAHPAPQTLREEVLLAALEAVRPRSRERRELRWSAVLALGLAADADGEQIDREAREKLTDLVASGKDLVERQHAVMALANCGARAGSGDDAPLAAADDVRGFLLRRLAHSNSRDAVWNALALGVHGNGLTRAGEAGHADTDRALTMALEDVASPLDSGAYSLALGLRSAALGAPVLSELLADRGNDDRRSFAALGLGLMDHRAASPQLAEVAADSTTRPGLHIATSFARGMCADARNTGDLVAQLSEAKTYLEQVTLATSLGRMGDERAVAPLLEVMRSEENTHEARAAAAQALGELCDPADAPWHRALVDGLNYMAAPGSLLGSFGVLDRR